MKNSLLLLILLTGFIKSAFAYNLGNTCKSVGSWIFKTGTCDAEGLLQGSGSATFKNSAYANLVTQGEFVNGLPNGKHMIQSFIDTYNSHQLKMSCELIFNRGKITNGEITCENDKGDSIHVLPGAGAISGEVVSTSFEGRSYIRLTVDLPFVAFKGKSKLSRFPPFTGTIDGQADQLTLKIGEDRNYAFSLNVSNLKTKISSSNFGFDGTLSIECHQECTAYPFMAELVNGKVDARGLAKIKINSNTYDMVFRKEQPNESRSPDGYVLYFKNDSGLIFDSSTTNCKNSNNGARLTIMRNQNYKLDFIPQCGKVISPDGRTFDGEFDHRGNPILY